MMTLNPCPHCRGELYLDFRDTGEPLRACEECGWRGAGEGDGNDEEKQDEDVLICGECGSAELVTEDGDAWCEECGAAGSGVAPSVGERPERSRVA